MKASNDGATVADVREKQMAKYNTLKNKYSDFPVGVAVKVITPCQDFTFFRGETGVVIRNSGKYLGIIVRFDKKFKRDDFNFEPKDLLILGTKAHKCPHCGGAI